jgi:hypothetical protein
LLTKHCPVCAERTVDPFVSLLAPRCKLCRSKFRVRLPFGIGFGAHYVGLLLLLGSLAAAAALRITSLFTVGFFLFVVLELVVFWIGRLEADTRDPVTAMQLRRLRGRAPRP